MPHPPQRALTAQQERRLATWLDDRFLALTRGCKKRSQPDSDYPTLSHYLDAAHAALSMVLQIPPIDPSTSLRTAYLLRLTHDVLAAVPGYPATIDHIPNLLNWFDDLDNAWVVVLQAQVWHPEHGPMDLEIEAEAAATGMHSSPVTETERTRLRGLLIGGSATLEEWLDGGGLLQCFTGDEDEEDGEDVAEIGTVQDAFGELFHRTLQELGALGGLILTPFDEETIPCTAEIS
ncbi:hypothetical protein GGX14DRAFT_353754 [Mycena pura]|uniref:Uncharacterized protein n=1 Tax=Mycena pura TaxID=153505 RepID=A0AAD6YK78_9AGAR|nr:hypothetical protein GGX14DRAFT_353754 [Mycena pura]